MFEVGQKVWDVVAGEGTVIAISMGYTYPVLVKFTDGAGSSYRRDGRRHEDYIPSLYPYPVEIIKKVTKPTINWEHVRGEYKFLAQDVDGSAWLYWEEPKLCDVGWYAELGDFALADSHVSYTTGTCDWKDSLVARPEGA